jgi:phage head maturation protease
MIRVHSGSGDIFLQDKLISRPELKKMYPFGEGTAASKQATLERRFGDITSPSPAARKQFEDWMKNLQSPAIASAKAPGGASERSAEIAALRRSATRRIGGLAVPFSTESLLYDGSFRRRYEIGCFDESLRDGREIKILMEHDETRCIGSTATGELRLKADYFGLHYEATLDAEFTELLAKRGFAVSCGHNPIDVSTEMVRGVYIENFTKSELLEISFVRNPRFGGTRVKLL